MSRTLWTMWATAAVVCTVVMSFLSLGGGNSDPPEPSPRTKLDYNLDYERIRTQIPQFTNRIMTCRNVPGMFVSVMHKEEEIITRGFGLSDISSRTAVNEKTLFGIGTVTNMFTATLIGILLSRNEERYPLGYNTLVVDIMGKDFKMSDDTRTKQATVKDVLAYRLGMPSHTLTMRMGLDLTRTVQEYCRRLKYIAPLPNSFRDKYIYSTYMYVLAGCIAEKLGGDQTYPTLLRTNIFQPLEMNSTTTIGALLRAPCDEQANKDGWVGPSKAEHRQCGQLSHEADDSPFETLSSMYYMNDTTKNLQKINPHMLSPTELFDPARGIVSNAEDMKRWQTMLLRNHVGDNETTTGSQKLMPAKYWIEMFKSHVTYRYERSKYRSAISETADGVGLGWRCGYYRGFERHMDFGSLYGFESMLTLIPELDIAIYTNTNGPEHRGFLLNKALHSIILDIVFNGTSWITNATVPVCPDIAAINQFAHMMPVLEYADDGNVIGSEIELLTNELGDSSLAASYALEGLYKMYEGTYGHRMFGNITIVYSASQKTLNFRFGLIGAGKLIKDGAVWCLELTEVMSYLNRFYEHRLNDIKFQFTDLKMDEQVLEGRYASIRAIGFEKASPPVFVRDLYWEEEAHVGGSSCSVADKTSLMLGLLITLGFLHHETSI